MKYLNLNLVTICLLLSTICLAQKFRKYPFVTGIVEYKLEGYTTGKQITYWDEYGYKEMTHVISETTMFGETTSNEKTTLTLGDYVYEWTVKDNNLFKSVNPLVEIWGEGNFSEKMLAEFTNKTMEVQGFEKKGSEKVLNRQCDIYNGLGRTWIWHGIPLKTEVKILDKKSIIEATNIKTNVVVSSFKFELPEGRILIDNASSID